MWVFAIEAGDLPVSVKKCREILRQISLPCVGTPADILLVFHTL